MAEYEITEKRPSAEDLGTAIREALSAARQAGWADARDVYAHDQAREIFADTVEATKAEAEATARAMWNAFYDYVAAVQ